MSHLEKRKNLMFKILNFLTKFRAIHVAVILSLNKFTTAFFLGISISILTNGFPVRKSKSEDSSLKASYIEFLNRMLCCQMWFSVAYLTTFQLIHYSFRLLTD